MNMSGDDFIYRENYIQKAYAFLFVLGITTGTLILNFMLEYKGAYLLEEIQRYHHMLVDSFEINWKVFFRICLWRMGIAAFIYIIIQVMGNCYVIYLCIFLFGSSFGYTLSLLSVQYGWKGILCIIVYMLPHYIIYMPLIAAILKETSSQMYKTLQLNFASAILVLALIFVGSGAESLINPVLLKIFLKKFLI